MAFRKQKGDIDYIDHEYETATSTANGAGGFGQNKVFEKGVDHSGSTAPMIKNIEQCCIVSNCTICKRDYPTQNKDSTCCQDCCLHTS